MLTSGTLRLVGYSGCFLRNDRLFSAPRRVKLIMLLTMSPFEKSHVQVDLAPLKSHSWIKGEVYIKKQLPKVERANVNEHRARVFTRALVCFREAQLRKGRFKL